MNKPLVLQYNIPAPEYADFFRSRIDDRPYAGWEKWSLPLGNSHFGASIFGRTVTDRIQITENSLANPVLATQSWKRGNGGTRSFGDIIFDFGHNAPVKYKRSLSLDEAIARVSYEFNKAEYTREYFLSYPDNVLAMRFTVNKSNRLNFSVAPLISFCRDYCVQPDDGCGRTGEVFSTHNDITMKGVSEYYGIQYEGRMRVKVYGGTLSNEKGTIRVKNAESTEIYFTCATNYRMEERVFSTDDPKEKLAPYENPGEKVLRTLNAACAKGYEALKAAHLKDYTTLFSRVSLSLGGKYRDIPTNEMLELYKRGDESRYAEELLFQYGRYLLIASSREGGYPANLQGTWCAYDSSPWGCDYHHNINVQMNYWHAETANLSECFEPYSAYAKAYMPLARKNADKYILQNYPEKYSGRGTNGWIVGTSGTLYTIEAPNARGHSGPGTGPLTALLFWDHYDFTRNKAYLRETVYPYLLEMSRFLLKLLVEEDGKLLVKLSSSPEQIGKDGKYYVSRGTAFDQQMVYENFDKTLRAAELLGITDEEEPMLEDIMHALPLLDPVIIGNSGQVKEYREETHYASIGEKTHRHISQLVGLYPGSLINKKTPDWLNAAKVTLKQRSDKAPGWGAAHRLCLWARTGHAANAYHLYRTILKNSTLPNFLSTHPPFQIDGNFGATAGVCEMLLQSHAGYIELLPALPDAWKNGHFLGLCTRGGFTVGCVWENKQPKHISVYSSVGGVCRLKFKSANIATIDNIEFSVDGDILFFPTMKGETVHIVVGSQPVFGEI